jgi:hypothetical protein
MGPPDGPNEPIRPQWGPLMFMMGPFAGSLGVEVGRLVFHYFFLSLIHQLDLVLLFWPLWAPLGLSRAHFRAPKCPLGPQGPPGLLYFDSFFFFSNRTFVCFHSSFLSRFLSATLLGAPWGPLGTIPGPPWSSLGQGPRHNCVPCYRLTPSLVHTDVRDRLTPEDFIHVEHLTQKSPKELPSSWAHGKGWP